MLKKIRLFVVLIFFTLSCGTSSTSSDCERTGAVCKDGTTSTATGSGACSSHGGVDHWICK